MYTIQLFDQYGKLHTIFDNATLDVCVKIAQNYAARSFAVFAKDNKQVCSWRIPSRESHSPSGKRWGGVDLYNLHFYLED